MTTNDPTEDPQSGANRHPFPADEQKDGGVDAEKTADLAKLPEGRVEAQLQTQQVKDRTEAEAAKDKLTFHFDAPNPAENIDKGELDARRLLLKEEVTNVEEEGVESPGDVQNSETGAPHEIDNLESDDKRAARMLTDPAEEQGTPSAPACSKEAVQDPGVVDTPAVADNGVIDVDTFDDDVSDDDQSAPSPAVDETMAELDTSNEPSNDETQGVVNHDAPSEPIDLTVSPSPRAEETSTLRDSDEKMNTEEITAMERHDAIHRQSVIDVDEPEGQDDENVAIEVANQRFGAEDINSPPVEEDEKHVTGTTDTETASADLNADVNGEEFSSGETPVGPTALEATQGEVESRLSPDRAGVANNDEEEERSAREGGMGSEDDALEPQRHEGIAIKEGGIDFMEVSAPKPDSESGEHPMAEDESEDDESEDDAASEPHEQEHEENEGEEDGSKSSPSEATGSENEAHEKTTSTDQNEGLVEEIQDKDFRQPEPDKHVVTDLQDREATSRSNETDEKTARPSNDDEPTMNPTNEEDDATVTSDGEPQPVQSLERAEQDASAIEVAALKESTMVDTETGELDLSHTARACVTPDPVSLEPSDSKEMQSSTLGSDLLLSKVDNKEGSGEDVIIGSADRENEATRSAHSAAPSMKAASTLALKQQDHGLSGAEEETDKRTEAILGHHMSTAGASEAVKQTAVPEKSPVEVSKSTGAGHLAPMFGIQLSRPIKSGPVTFSSPPSFPRYSLNPQAAPFLPAKLRKSESSEQPAGASETPSVAVSTPSDEAKITDEKAPHVTAEKDEPDAMETDDFADKNMETVPITSFDVNSSNTATKSQISVEKAPPPVALTESAKQTSKEASAQYAPQINIASVAQPSMKSSLKQAVQKKVSFALTPTEIEDPESEKGHTAETGPVHPVHKGRGKAGLAEQPILLDVKAGNEKRSKPGRNLVEVDEMKEKQRIVQVQTDEGLRREVKNVTVAMREGNSKVRPERKKFTVRLTTGTEEKAKLQFFKATGPSLKLYASLDSMKENLRVRKVTNRRYVMSVAKVASPGDDAADIIVKYFLHFEEQDTFEEMYSQCVANLQKKLKPTVRTKKTDEQSKISQTGIDEMKQDTKRLSPKNTGVKRSAETVSAAQVNKKSKLLADKQKLLDKMAALRRKKEQKGTSVAKERQTQPGGLVYAGDASDKGTMRSDPSDPLKTKDVETKPKSMKVDSSMTQGTAATPTESKQPPRKRTAEDVSKENASKRVRLPGMHSTDHAIGMTRALLPDGKSKPQTRSPTSMRGATKKLKKASVDIDNPPSISRANHSKSHNVSFQKHSGELSSEKGVPGMDTAKEHESKEAEALKKVMRDLRQSEDEKNALQIELDSRNRLLNAEREKSLRVERESSDAWQRIVKTVEALSADMRRLRREDTDRSLESLARCEASSSEDFFDRLHTFRPSTWAAFEDSNIGAMECALRGWYNCGPGKIRSSEGSEITLSESFDDANFRQGEVETVSSLLREGHCLLSGWIGQSCPESFRTLEGSQRLLTKEKLRANVEGIRKGLELSETRFAWGASALLLSDDICEKLAVYNWRMDGECLRCSWCNRRVCVEDEIRFDAKSQHYAFCPFRAADWKSSVLRNATILGIEGDGDAVMKV